MQEKIEYIEKVKKNSKIIDIHPSLLSAYAGPYGKMCFPPYFHIIQPLTRISQWLRLLVIEDAG